MKKVKTVIGYFIVASTMIFTSCGDGFKTVKIGQQKWMVKNLNVNTFKNGDTIPEAKTLKDWKRANDEGKPTWCYYDNNPANGEIYGKLYNFYTVNDPRGLAPSGWHVASVSEWGYLTNYLGEFVAGFKMKSKNGWKGSHNDTNESGFSALPGGYRLGNGEFNGIGNDANWWSQTDSTLTKARALHIGYGYYGFKGNVSGVMERLSNKECGYSVRCVRY